jgi:isoleucyl-tRNA synthetase
LSDFPAAREYDKDAALEARMELVRQVVSLGRGVREKARLKVRQPLSRVMIDGAHEPLLGGMTELVTDELNVKEVVFLKDASEYMNYEIKPDFKAAGPVFGKNVKDFAAALAALPAAEAVALTEAFSGDAGDEAADSGASSEKTVQINVGGSDVDVTKELVDIRVSAKEGYAVAMEGGVFVIVDTTLTPELVREGIAREFVSKVQQLRKQKDLEMMDRIALVYEADDEVADAVSVWGEYIAGETLADETLRAEEHIDGEDCELNGHKAVINLRRV